MPKDLDVLKDATNAISTLAISNERNPLLYFRPTPIQKSVLQDRSRSILLRGGNQLGKTLVGCFETHCRAIGWHPYKKVSKKPQRIWIIVHSWEQSRAIQQKFWEMAPKELLHKDTLYNEGSGFVGKYPTIKYKSGSVVMFKTTNQTKGDKTIALESDTVDFIWVDEPPPPNVYNALNARTTRTRGSILYTLTPVGNPVEHLKDMVEKGLISEHVGEMTVENNIPDGCRLPLMVQKELDDLEESYLPFDRNARMRGDWSAGLPEEPIFAAFKEKHLKDAVPDPVYFDDEGRKRIRKYIFVIAFDHGHEIDSQCGLLLAIDITKPSEPIVYVADEYVSGGESSDVHAQCVLDMIKRNGLTIEKIDLWIGDRAHNGKTKGTEFKRGGSEGKMSNKILMASFAHVLGYSRGRLPFYIHTAFKPNFSLYYTVKSLHNLIRKDRFFVLKRCERVKESFLRWETNSRGDLDPRSEWKHCIDAVRYGIMPVLSEEYNRGFLPSTIYLRR